MHDRGTSTRVRARVGAMLVTSVALLGTSLPHVAAAGTVSCNIPQPCALYQNAQGPGVQGSSAKSNGSVGVTTFNATSLTSATSGVRGADASTNNNAYNAGVFGTSNGGFGVKGQSTGGVGVFGTSSKKTGVLGNTTNLSGSQNAVAGIDLATNGGFNNGVFGSVTNGGWGVLGTSGDGAYGGVEGLATTAYGVEGASTSGTGVFALSSTGTGLYAHSSTGLGVYGTSSSSNVAIEGYNFNNGDGIYGRSDNGYGVEGYATANDAGHFTNGGTGTGVAAIATSGLALYAATASGNGADIRGSYIGVIGRSDAYPLVLTNSVGANIFQVDGSGNVAYHGTLSTFVVTRTGQTAVAYATHSTTTNVEDAGSAQLVNGTATVPLDPAFAASIDLSAPYHVFLTPGGDTNGLYIASKSPTSFVVRETKGGRSTLSFDYRILANAMGHARDRMAFVNAATLRTALAPRVTPHASHAAVPPTPAKPKL